MDVIVSDMQGDGAAAASSGVCVQRMTFSAGFSARRSGDLLTDGNDDIILYLHQAGSRVVAQLDREAQISPGGGLLCSNADASKIVVPESSRFLCLALSRRPLLALVPSLEDMFVQPLSDDAGVLQLLGSYLSILEQGTAGNTSELRQPVISHIYDLVAVALGAARDQFEIACGRGIRSARLHAVKTDIAKNRADGDVRAGALAIRHRVTPRYIHKLFESEGTTLSKFVLRQRLSRVHRMLTDVRNATEPIGALAFAVGFGDLSTFNHAFRRHYGVTPSDVRFGAGASFSLLQSRSH